MDTPPKVQAEESFVDSLMAGALAGAASLVVLGTASIATTLVAGFSFGFYLALSAAIPTCALAGVFGFAMGMETTERRVAHLFLRARPLDPLATVQTWLGAACIAALGCLIGGALFPVGLG